MHAARPNSQIRPRRRAEEDSVQWRLPAHPSAVGIARNLVGTVCRIWRAPSVTDSAVLAVSELVGNVVTAGGREATLRLSRTSARLRLEVCDAVAGPLPSVQHPPPSEAEGGRGLWLVSQLAVDWGSFPIPNGKCVWAEFALTGRQ